MIAAVCLVCGGPFEARRSTASYCSPHCKEQARPSRPKRAPNAKGKERADAFERFGTTCSNCKASGRKLATRTPAIVADDLAPYRLLLCSKCEAAVGVNNAGTGQYTSWQIVARRMSDFEIVECLDLQRIYSERGLTMPRIRRDMRKTYRGREVSLDAVLYKLDAMEALDAFDETDRVDVKFESAPSNLDDYYYLGDPLLWIIAREERDERRAARRAYRRGLMTEVEYFEAEAA